MIRTRINKLFRSVFTKLILINLATWVLIMIAVAGILFLSKHKGKPFSRNARLYLQYIVKDLGSPPDKTKALALAKESGIEITFSGDVTWTTLDQLPELDKIRYSPNHSDSKAQFGKLNGRTLLKIETDDGKLYFNFSGFNKDRQQNVFHLLLIFIPSIILLACYLALKRLLRPLKRLETGVAEVSTGNLTHRVPTRGNDELTELANSFNDMTARLQQIMETKEHLLRDISHELRSPLTRMKVALALLGDEQIKAEIEQDIVEMETMVSSILDSARDHQTLQQNSLIKCDLVQLALSIIEKYSNMSPGVHYLSAKEPIMCTIDEQAIQTVLTNLIDNGLKFSGESRDGVEISISTDKKVALMSVVDHGDGVDSEELPFIFEPFYRVDKSRSRRTGGFGLGLSLCKAIIEAHGGKIEVKSQIGVGTQISFTLPLEYEQK